MSERETDGKVGGELLSELFSALEDLETQSSGILQFLKDKGLANDEELAPYLEAAARASDVRWRAARLRMDALLSAAIEDAEEEFARKIEERKKEQARKAEEGKEKKPETGGESRPERAWQGSKSVDKNVEDPDAEARGSVERAGREADSAGGKGVDEKHVEPAREETAKPKTQRSEKTPEGQPGAPDTANEKVA